MPNLPLGGKKSRYALGAACLAGAALLLFIFAGTEQSIRSGGDPEPAALTLQQLIASGPGANQHVTLTGFTIGKQYIYSAKLVNFRDVYLPLFAAGQPETAANLRVLLWIRNDRTSNQSLVQSREDLDRLALVLNTSRNSVTGILRKPAGQVLALTEEAYPGVNRDAMQLLWARHFPDQQAIAILWLLCLLAAGAAIACTVAFRRAR